jgi:hypothetical protein
LGELEKQPHNSPDSLSERYTEWYPHAVLPFIAALASPVATKLEGNLLLPTGIVEEGRLDVSNMNVSRLQQTEGGPVVTEWVNRFRHHEKLVIAAVTKPSYKSIRAAIGADPSVPKGAWDYCARAVTSAFESQGVEKL